MNFPLAFDVLMAILLMVTIGYAVILNRRLSTWRRDRGELEKIIARFDRAAERAETGLAHLKVSSAEVGQLLDNLVNRGDVLRDDLVYLLDRAEPVINRLDNVRRGQRRVETNERHEPTLDPAIAELALGRAAPRATAR